MSEMSEFIILFTVWLGTVVAVVSFWVWLGTLLIWKIFAVIGASSLIYPSFWIMILGAVVALTSLLIGYLVTA